MILQSVSNFTSFRMESKKIALPTDDKLIPEESPSVVTSDPPTSSKRQHDIVETQNTQGEDNTSEGVGELNEEPPIKIKRQMKKELSKTYIKGFAQNPLILSDTGIIALAANGFIYIGQTKIDENGEHLDPTKHFKIPNYKVWEIVTFFLKSVSILEKEGTFEGNEDERILLDTERSKICMKRSSYGGNQTVDIRRRFRPDPSEYSNYAKENVPDSSGYFNSKVQS